MTQARSTSRVNTPRKRRQASAGSGYTKFAVTVPRELAEAARKRVESGRTATMSVLVTEALAEKLEQDDLRTLLDEMESEFGPVPAETQAWANQLIAGIPES